MTHAADTPVSMQRGDLCWLRHARYFCWYRGVVESVVIGERRASVTSMDLDFNVISAAPEVVDMASPRMRLLGAREAGTWMIQMVRRRRVHPACRPIEPSAV